LACVIGLTAGGHSVIQPAAAACDATLTAALGEGVVRKIQRNIEKAAAGFRPRRGVVAEELAYTVSETLPLFKKKDLLNPVTPRSRIITDAYFGDEYKSSSPDVFILPKDERMLCTLAVGRAVFLSDGVTHHYALVDSVDYKRKIVTLLDPWASVSFLLPDHNVIGVNARAYSGQQGQPLLDLSFDDYMRAIHGQLEMIVWDPFFNTMEKVYSDIARSEEYLVWKYSRILESGDFDNAVLTTIMLSTRPDINTKPKLRLLTQYAKDYTIAVVGGFSIPEPGRATPKEDIPKLREAFINRLPQYGDTLPWALKWLLLGRTQESEDSALRLAIVDAFLNAVPTDTDFQIARAETLLRLRRPDEPMRQLDTAGEQWAKDVGAVVAKKPTSEAVAFFFKKDYGLQSLNVLHWRYARIRLLRAIAKLSINPTADTAPELSDLQDKYVVGAVLVDFFPELLKIAFLQNDKADEELYIKTVAQLPKDNDRADHFAVALYEHLTTRRRLTDMSEPIRTVLRTSYLRAPLCDFSSSGTLIRDMQEPLTAELAKFCGAPKPKDRSGKPSRSK
jgi:hypothetical protein